MQIEKQLGDQMEKVAGDDFHKTLLKEQMKEYARRPICLAFSGGVDSSLLLKLACDNAKKTGNPVYAVTFDTMLHPACDIENAKRVAKEMEAVHTILKIDELEMEELRNNPVNRCYLCKKHLFETLRDFAQEKQIACILDGTNEDDLHVYRPGIKALRELDIKSPLAACHMTKREVKQMAAEYGISAASRPSTPCMATRIPYGEAIDYELLSRIEKGEAYLQKYISGNIRLRVHGKTARLEVDPEQMSKVLSMRGQLAEALKNLGFYYITLDLEGFRSGSMDLYMPAELKTTGN